MVADPDQVALLLEKVDRAELIGKRVKLSDGRQGPIVHVEYEAPERVALVKTYPETPSPLTRVAVDRLSPPHLPYILEIKLDRSEGDGKDGN
jgi:hypothetical protein